MYSFLKSIWRVFIWERLWERLWDFCCDGLLRVRGGYIFIYSLGWLRVWWEHLVD